MTACLNYVSVHQVRKTVHSILHAIRIHVRIHIEKKNLSSWWRLYLHLLHELMNTDQADPNKQLRLSIVL